MADQQTDIDVNEPATPYKLDKAHERGSIFRSADMTFAVVLFACIGCVYGLGLRVEDGVAGVLRHGLAFVSRSSMTSAALPGYVALLVAEAIGVVGPILFVVWIAALLVAGAQARGVFSAQPLQPDFGRLNPAQGFKKLFSIRSLHELWRSGARLLVIVLALYSWGRNHLLDLLSLAFEAPRSAQHSGISLLGSALVVLAGIVAAFALLDWGFNRWDYLRQMRMSRREVKEEHKEREGDQRIKARRRELRIQWLKGLRQLAKVRNADVLITNPTHVAIALEYRHGEMPAPLITARGAGEMARRMRVEARRRAVPIFEHPQLARALFALRDTQSYVPEEHFFQVARILRWVFAARGSGPGASV